MTGFLGGFTTFSAFSVDTLRLVEAGQGSLALVNVALNLFGSILAVTLGAWMARLI
jgi:CrcB protein